MFNLPLFPSHDPIRRPPQPFSDQTLDKAPRIAGATVTESVGPYCAVGCGQHIYTKGGQIIDIEGNPRSPINQSGAARLGLRLAAQPPHPIQPRLRRPGGPALVGTQEVHAAALQRIDTAAHAAEVITQLGFPAAAGPLAKPLTEGQMALPFWGGAACMTTAELLKLLPVRGRARRWADAASALCGLAGGLALRYSMVRAGPLSANDPDAARWASRPRE